MPSFTRKEIDLKRRIKLNDDDEDTLRSDFDAHEGATGESVHGLNSMSMQSKDAVNIDGGTVDGLTRITSVSASTLGLFGVASVTQSGHIADPTGGGTVDTQARSAINAILATLEVYGLTASS